jgi:hypothetical protein
MIMCSASIGFVFMAGIIMCRPSIGFVFMAGN